MNIVEKISAYIDDQDLLEPQESVLLAVSGGPDSLCLLDCMQKLGFRVRIAHLDHQLRKESGEEAAFVTAVAEKYGIQCIQDQEDVRAVIEEGYSVEEAARLVRYRFLVDVANQIDFKFIATGHTSDDQIETILMHFLRGAGPSGLAGMRPMTSLDGWRDIPNARGVKLVRPLLGISRADTVAHCHEIGLQPVIDSSNLDQTLHRNRIRHHLLPLLETYNPGIRGNVLRMGEIMSAETDYLGNVVKTIWEKVVSPVGESALLLHRNEFNQLHRAVQRAMLRSAVEHIATELRDTPFESIERGIDFIISNSISQTLPMKGKIELVPVEDDVLMMKSDAEVILPHYPQLLEKDAVPLPVPGKLTLANDWELITSIARVPDSFDQTVDHRDRVLLDLERLGTMPMVRTKMSGDRIRPLGFKGHQKLSDMFINEHIPAFVRARWPLVVSGDEIVWVSGVRLAHEFRIREDSQGAIEIRLMSPV
jgi:tRNA(Ile)-lysidine synthase